MTPSRRGVLAFLGIAAAAAVVSARSNSLWDYQLDAGPPIDALIHGRIGDFLSARPAMGPLSMLIRAPFAALSRITGDTGPHDFYLYLNAYRFGVWPCVVAGGLLGLWLAKLMREAGRPAYARLLVVVLCTINPVALRSVYFGHPEEILGAALAVGAVVAALRERNVLAGVLLALAIATKQWALLALLPVGLALGWRRARRPLLVLVGLGALVALPLLIANPHSLVAANTSLLDVRSQFVLPASVWWPFTSDLATSDDPAKHAIPEWLGTIGHPLVLVVGLLVPILLARRVRKNPGERVLPLLALVFLLRCMLDPVDNSYYHVPFYMALIATDALVSRTLAPALLVTLVLQYMTGSAHSPATISAVYLAWTIPMAIYLALRAAGVPLGSLRASLGPLRRRAAAG